MLAEEKDEEKDEVKDVEECVGLPHVVRKLVASLLEGEDQELQHVYDVVKVLWADRCEHHMVLLGP